MTKIQEIHKTTARYITLTLLFLSLFSAPIVQAQVRGTETIIVYRYEKFSAKQINSSMAYLRNFYSKVKYGGELTLPEKARYAPKGCYTATLLLNYQKAKKDKDNVVIAFTDKDICETKKNRWQSIEPLPLYGYELSQQRSVGCHHLTFQNVQPRPSEPSHAA